MPAKVAAPEIASEPKTFVVGPPPSWMSNVPVEDCEKATVTVIVFVGPIVIVPRFVKLPVVSCDGPVGEGPNLTASKINDSADGSAA